MGDFPPLGLATKGAPFVVEVSADSLAFFSSGEEVAGVAEVNALDCAHDGRANRKTTAMANARHFILVESLPGRLNSNQLLR